MQGATTQLPWPAQDDIAVQAVIYCWLIWNRSIDHSLPYALLVSCCLACQELQPFAVALQELQPFAVALKLEQRPVSEVYLGQCQTVLAVPTLPWSESSGDPMTGHSSLT